MVCIPCFLIAAAALILCLTDGAAVPFPVSCAALTFSLTFGLVTALHTNWKRR